MRVRSAVVSGSALVLAVTCLGLVPSEASDVDGASAKGFDNCTELNRAYSHGVSDKHFSKRKWIQKGASGKGKYKPSLYRQVASTMDRDDDHIACEK